VVEINYRELIEINQKFEELYKRIFEQDERIEELEAENKRLREALEGEEYAYESIEEYEDLLSCTMSEGFKMGWSMARIKMKHLESMANKALEGGE